MVDDPFQDHHATGAFHDVLRGWERSSIHHRKSAAMHAISGDVLENVLTSDVNVHVVITKYLFDLDANVQWSRQSAAGSPPLALARSLTGSRP